MCVGNRTQEVQTKQKIKERKPTILVLTLFSFVFDYFSPPPPPLLSSTLPPPSFSQIEHPFIVSLRFAFQTDAKLYMVFDFFNGGELFHYLSTGGRFDAERAKFYAAEIASGMGHLHNIGTPAVCEKSFFFLFFSDDDDEPIKNIYFYIIFL